MKYVNLGSTGVKVSELCFGTLSFGGDATEDEAMRLYEACRGACINFFDCANVYNAGRSEQILGRIMAADRDNLVVTSAPSRQVKTSTLAAPIVVTSSDPSKQA